MEEYNKIQAVRVSNLPLLLRSPLHYQHAVKNEVTSEAFTFGSFYHCAILEPDELRKRYYLIDPEQRPEQDKAMQSKINKAWAEQLAAENVGKEAISLSMKQDAMAMRAVLLGSPYPAALVAKKGHFEESRIWQVDGIEVKGRVDKRIESDRLILDLKTCTNATHKAFIRDGIKYHYPMKAAWYLNGFKADKFLWVAQEKEPPYAVNVFNAPKETLEWGAEQYTLCLNILKKVRAKYGSEWGSKQWPSYEFMENGWPDFDMPNWASIVD